MPAFLRRRSLEKRRARRRARGAVMVEAVIVTGMIVTVLISGIALFRVYASKINVTRDARFETWRPALSGCGSGANMGSIAAAAELPSGEGPPAMPADTLAGWLTLGGTAQGRSAGVPVFGRTQEVTSRRSVVCNESSGGGQDPGSLLGGISGDVLAE